MDSLLSSLNFGQRHAYFAVEITLHDLKDVPLLTGSFQARWKLRNAHNTLHIPSSASAIGHLPTTSALARMVRGPGADANDSSDDDEEEDEDPLQESAKAQEEADNSLSSRDFGSHTAPSINSSIGESDGSSSSPATTTTASPSSSSKGFLSTIFNRRHRKDSDQVQPQRDQSEMRRSASSSRTSLASTSAGGPSLRKKPSVASRRSNEQGERSSRSISLSGKQSPFSQPGVNGFGGHLEPSGSTHWSKIEDHVVKWERKTHAGIRVNVDKAKADAANLDCKTFGSASSLQVPNLDSPAAGGSSPMLRPRSSDRNLRAQQEEAAEKRDDLATAVWGQLANSELRVTIKQDVHTDHHGSDNPHNLGVVIINLAEFAPCPTKHAEHHHHHHHRHDSQHEHPSPALPPLHRTETRRYLLQRSKTNATLRITIALTHVGGSREYAVPPIARGLLIGTLPSTGKMEEERQQDSHSERSSLSESRPLATAPSSASLRSRAKSQQGRAPASSSSKATNEHHASRNSTRIPAKNFKDPSSKSSLQFMRAGETIGSINATSVAGKGSHNRRLAFAFGGSDSWERDPHEVIGALFSHAESASKGERRQHSPAQTRHRKEESDSSFQPNGPSSYDSGGQSSPTSSKKGRARAGDPSPASWSPQGSRRGKCRLTSTPTSAALASEADGSNRLPLPPQDSPRERKISSGSRVKWKLLASRPLTAPESRAEKEAAEALSSRDLDGDKTFNASQQATSSVDSQYSNAPTADASGSTSLGPSPSVSATPSRSTSFYLSPSASTIMGQDNSLEITPTPSRVVSSGIKARQQADEKDHEQPSVNQKTSKKALKKKLSKGVIGIAPENAKEQQYRGVGWQQSQRTRREGELSSNQQYGSGFGLGLYEYSSSKDEQGHLTNDTIRPASGVNSQGFPGKAATTSSQHSSPDEELEDEPDSIAFADSLKPYVDARLGRPKSKAGLDARYREADESSHQATSSPSNGQIAIGESASLGVPTSDPDRPKGDKGVDYGHRSAAAKKQDVPALIPGAAPIMFVPPSPTSPVVVRADKGKKEEPTIKASQSSSSLAGEGTSQGLTWSDAQTEMEARFCSPTISKKNLRPPPLLSSTPSYAGSMTRNNSFRSSSSQVNLLDPSSAQSQRSFSSNGGAGKKPRTISHASSTSSIRSLLRREQLVDRPGGVPAPASYVVKEMLREKEKGKRGQAVK